MLKNNTENLNGSIHLLPHQIEHVEKILKSLTKDGELSYIDSSRTGLGKTHTALALAYRLQKYYGLQVAIVAPNRQSLHNDDGWLYWAKKYDITITKATTYAALRSRKMMVYDDWLVKNDANKKMGYHASGKFNEIARQGIFLIFDEFHMATRESSTHYACAALVRACARYPAKNRVGLLSLTPGDQINHYPQIARLAGLMESTTICVYDRSDKDYEWKQYGLGQMIDSCVNRGANKPELYAQTQYLCMGKAKYLIGKFFQEYIKPRICFAMPIPENMNKISLRNIFLECYKEDLPHLNSAIDRLCDGVNWNGYAAAEKDEWNIGQINIALRLIERYKLRTIARYIKESSEKNPEKKFIVSMGSRCTAHFSMLLSMLRSMEVTVPYGTKAILDKARSDPANVWYGVNKDIYNYILTIAYKPEVDIMNGETSNTERIKMLRRFQAEKSDSWCLLISPGVGDKSISLHDVHGNHPRELIVVPDHFHTRITQTCGRTDRVGVKSDVEVSVMYCKETRLETSVIQSMIRKSEIAGNMLAPNQTHLFPGKYDIVVEKDPEDKIKTEILVQLN